MKKHFGVLLLILLFLMLVLSKVSEESKTPVANQQAERNESGFTKDTK